MSADIANDQSCVSVDIERSEEDPLVISLDKELSSWPPLSRNHCIYRVSHRMRGDGSLYNPNMVSIGPLHHGRKGLEAMEEYKQRFLVDFLRRTGVKLEDYARFIKDRERRLRHCYSDTIHLTSDELTKIFMVDAAFLVELLLKNTKRVHDDGCRIFGRPGMKFDILADIILLENQIPMFILEDIFDYWIIKEEIQGRNGIDLIPLVCRLINNRSDMMAKEYDLEEVQSSAPVHLLDCLRCCYIFAGFKLEGLPERDWNVVGNTFTPSATELHQAGLKFRKSPSPNLFSIKLEDGVLMVPHLYVGFRSESIYRNLVAFEQFHYNPHDRLFSEFFSLMDRLINTANDIDLLVKNGIIRQGLGDGGEAANVFNRMSKGLQTFDRRHFAGLRRDLRMYYERPWNRWKATLKQTYFNTPWGIISLAAAAILLILTVIQTVFSIIK